MNRINNTIYLVLFLLSYYVNSLACLVEYPTHNYYMISYVNKSYDFNIFSEEINYFWKEYTNGKYEEFPLYDRPGLEDYIRQKGDNEMLDYLQCLNTYLDICNDIQYSWEYPSEEDLQNRNFMLKNIKKKSLNYSGSRLVPQYSLMLMRCNMLLGDWHENKTFWEQKGNKLPDSVFRKMMENIYAGALYRDGEIQKATAIYVSQGDQKSIKWSLNKYRNVDGIWSLYSQDPNSPLLPYLIEDFVNNVQESIDSHNDEESIINRGRKLVLSIECLPFYKIAEQVINDGVTENPCMWSTAEAMLYYLTGNQSQAEEISKRSLKLKGNSRVLDNCRCVNILIFSNNKTYIHNTLHKDLKWLENKISTETSDSYCYSNAYERIMMKSLYPQFESEGNYKLALATVGLYNEMVVLKDEYNYRSPKYDSTMGVPSWNNDFDNEFMNLYLYNISATQCSDYYNYIKSEHEDSLESYICSHVYKNEDFFNDLIGTKYISEGKFSQAIPYLEKVNLSYLCKLNYNAYMNRDFTKERWFYRQFNPLDIEGINNNKQFLSNPKIDYCNTIIETKDKFNKAKQTRKKELLAYKLANLYYQASYKGDCWWLTEYSYRTNAEKPNYNNELDFIKKAKDLLEFCSKSKNKDLRTKSLYALAFIPVDQWSDYELDYDDEGNIFTTYTIIHPSSKQYQYLDLLNSYFELHKDNCPDYISKCDVLHQFRKMRWFAD